MHPYLFIYFQQKKSLPCTLNPLDKVVVAFCGLLGSTCGLLDVGMWRPHVKQCIPTLEKPIA